jgi:hypothetical protein
MEERIKNESELLAWIEGDATPEQEMRVSAQLAHDPQLSRLAHELRADRVLLQQLGEVEPPAELFADAQARLERSQLLESPDGDTVHAAPPSAGTRRGRRLGAWGSLAAVFLVAVTLGVTWKLGVFRTGPAVRPPASSGDSTLALGETETDVDRGVDTHTAAREENQGSRQHPLQPDDRLDRAVVASDDLIAEGVLAGRDRQVTAKAATEKGADDDEALRMDHADLEAPAEERLLAGAEIPDNDASMGAPLADVEAALVEPAEESAPATVLVWSGEVRMEVEPALLEDPVFQRNLSIRVSHDPQENLRRNAGQMGVGVLQQQIVAPTPPTDALPNSTTSRLGGAELETEEVARGRRPEDEIKGILNDEPAFTLPVAEPLTIEEFGEGTSDYGQIMMQMPGGEVYEVEVSMRRLPGYVDVLNTPTQSAWLEYDATRRLRSQEARRRLLSGRSIFWWRQEAWEASRTQTVYRLYPLPSKLIDDADPASVPADSADETDDATSETPK